MGQSRAEIIAWVAGNVIPHEAALRARLRRMVVEGEEIDDIVQETYLSIARLKSVEHILDGRGYLFTAARMVMLQRIRRNRIVRIDRLTEAQALALEDDAPGPEQHVAARRELARVRRMIEELPPRCREIFELRRVEGVSQREISERLNLPEHTVEQQAIRGLKLILKAIASEDQESVNSSENNHAQVRGTLGNG